MLLGSWPWASADEHRRYYVSRGEVNPNPEKYVDQSYLRQALKELGLKQ